MNLKLCEYKLSWTNVKYYPEDYMDVLRKTRGTSLNIGGI